MSKANYGATAALTALLSGTKYIALHTASPGVGGTQATNAATYTGYAQKSTTFNISGTSATIPSTITFAQATSGPTTITHISVGDGTNIDYFGALGASITISSGQFPKITALTISES